MLWRRKKPTPTPQAQYPSADVALDAVRREYEFEFERGSKLDARVNITITFAGVLFLYVIKFFDFHLIPSSLNTWLFRICAVVQVLDVAFFISATLFLLILLLNRLYFHFSVKKLLVDSEQKNGPNYKVEDPSQLRLFILTEYIKAIAINAETNKSRALRYNLSVILLAASVLFSITLDILILNFF